MRLCMKQPAVQPIQGRCQHTTIRHSYPWVCPQSRAYLTWHLPAIREMCHFPLSVASQERCWKHTGYHTTFDSVCSTVGPGICLTHPQVSTWSTGLFHVTLARAATATHQLYHLPNSRWWDAEQAGASTTAVWSTRHRSSYIPAVSFQDLQNYFRIKCGNC